MAVDDLEFNPITSKLDLINSITTLSDIYLKLDGSNANSDINIGAYNIFLTGTINAGGTGLNSTAISGIANYASNTGVYGQGYYGGYFYSLVGGNVAYAYIGYAGQYGIYASGFNKAIYASGKGFFSDTLEASSFVKTAGASSQFLKADGSVDSSTYLTADPFWQRTSTTISPLTLGDNIWTTGTITTNSIISKGTTAGDVAQLYMGFNIVPVPQPPKPTVALAGAGAGNVDNGLHYYFVTYLTAYGETDMSLYTPPSVTVVDKTTNGKVTVTIPVSSDYRVTGRKIYRTKVGESAYNAHYVDTVPNNTAVTYVDNIADSAIAAASSWYRDNITTSYISVGGVATGLFSSSNTILGVNAGATIMNGTAATSDQTVFGTNALASVTTATGCSAFGSNALSHVTTGGLNDAFGLGAGAGTTDGAYNASFGHNAFYQNPHGNYNSIFGEGAGSGNASFSHCTIVGCLAGVGTGTGNTLIGSFSGNAMSSGAYNVLVGHYTGADSLTTGSRNVWLGDSVGQKENLSDSLIIDNQLRAVGVSATNSIIFGTMAAAVANQTLRINAAHIDFSALPTASASVNTGELWVDTTGGLNIIKRK